jgi:hypothetical protein
MMNELYLCGGWKYRDFDLFTVGCSWWTLVIFNIIISGYDYQVIDYFEKTAYISLVRSLFDYSSTVWDPHLQKDIDRIENVQRRAARFIYSGYIQYYYQRVWLPGHWLFWKEGQAFVFFSPFI